VSELPALVQQLREGRGFLHKRDIGDALTTLSKALPEGLSQAALIGDDCAAIPDGDGYLLFAIEGFVDDFVQGMPWFAGWSGVMVNLSDIAAMGGRGLGRLRRAHRRRPHQPPQRALRPGGGGAGPGQEAADQLRRTPG
jgi:selenophosphate synthetase-related protein